jgi:uncharacterized protein YcgL (UPF0745 family)
MIDPKSSKTTGYHLFIEPKDALREKLQSVIDSLATEYGSPRFAPHVTLLACIPGNSDQEVLETAKNVRKKKPSRSCKGRCCIFNGG